MNLSKTLVVLGLLLVGAGLYVALADRLPGLPRLDLPRLSRLHLGRLPGDIRLERSNVRLYFPWVTCLVLSVVLTLVLRWLGRWR